jgi:hypothetical protein
VPEADTVTLSILSDKAIAYPCIFRINYSVAGAADRSFPIVFGVAVAAFAFSESDR